MTRAHEIAPGLARWTAWHDHWEENVRSVAVETSDGLVVTSHGEPVLRSAKRHLQALLA